MAIQPVDLSSTLSVKLKNKNRRFAKKIEDILENSFFDRLLITLDLLKMLTEKTTSCRRLFIVSSRVKLKNLSKDQMLE